MAHVLGFLLILLPAFAVLADTPPQYRVAVIDKFYPPIEELRGRSNRQNHWALYGLADLNRDGVREPIYHGDLVTLIAAHPQLSFVHYPMRNNGKPMEEILHNLRELRLRHLQAPVDALLLCWESSTLISAFASALLVDHAGAYKRLIDYWGIEDPSWRATGAIIEELEWFADSGVVVVTIAGNGGAGMVNAFSFADGVITVGAREKALSRFVADNPFVDTYAQAAYEITPETGLGPEIQGYDINADGCIDIPLERLSAPSRQLGRSRWIKGSSFAAPQALHRLLPGLQMQSCP